MSRKRSLEPENVGASTTKQKEVSMFKKRKEGDSSEKSKCILYLTFSLCFCISITKIS